MAAAVAVPVDALGSAHGTVGALAAPAAPPLNTLTTPTTQSTSSVSTPAALFAEAAALRGDREACLVKCRVLNDRYPAHARAWALRSTLELDAATALGFAERAAALKPELPDAAKALRLALTRRARAVGGAAERAALLERAARLRPADAEAWFRLGRCRREAKDAEGAAAAYREAAALDPDHERAGFWLAACEGRAVAGPPLDHVRRLYDGYADRYDDHLTSALGSRAPRLAAEALARALSDGPAARVFDLGCGTGLSGLALRAAGVVGGELVGVDLSEAMCAKARETGAYASVHAGELRAFSRVSSDFFSAGLDDEEFVGRTDIAAPQRCGAAPDDNSTIHIDFTFRRELDDDDGFSGVPSVRGAPRPPRRAGAALEASGGGYDALCSSDTLPYFGDLAPFFAAAFAAANAGCVLGLTLEDTLPGAAADYHVALSGRCRHAPGYATSAAEAAGWATVAATSATLRRNAGADVAGTVYVFRKP